MLRLFKAEATTSFDLRSCQTWLSRKAWQKMSILNVARVGKFSSDRAVREYCDKIWQTKPVEID